MPNLYTSTSACAHESNFLTQQRLPTTVLPTSTPHLSILGYNIRPPLFAASYGSGFPPALMELKQAINDTVSGLPPEYSGSKWPKTSLGALHDKARLTPEQLDRLNSICR